VGRNDALIERRAGPIALGDSVRATKCVAAVVFVLSGCAADSVTAPTAAPAPVVAVNPAVAVPGVRKTGIILCRCGSPPAPPGVLWVVDGLVVSYSEFSLIEASAIEDVKVVQGIAAAAVFGHAHVTAVVTVRTKEWVRSAAR